MFFVFTYLNTPIGENFQEKFNISLGDGLGEEAL